MIGAAIAAMAAAIVGSIGTIQASSAQASAQRREARAYELQAQSTMNAAESEASQLRMQKIQSLASSVVAGAGAGVNLQSGSLTSIMNETSANYDRDIRQLQTTGSIQSAALRNTAGNLRKAATQTKISGYFSAGTTLLKGASSAMSYGAMSSSGGSSGAQIAS